jgi:AcrR family transcriptional regulator
VLDAALELFAEHGVSGTSLQMIADHMGVTKAAVYYQFQAKEQIVLAVLEPALTQMATVVAAGEAAPTHGEAA